MSLEVNYKSHIRPFLHCIPHFQSVLNTFPHASLVFTLLISFFISLTCIIYKNHKAVSLMHYLSIMLSRFGPNDSM